MSNGIKKIMWGLLIESFHITVGGFPILPPIVGVILIFLGIRELTGQSPKICWILMIWQLVMTGEYLGMIIPDGRFHLGKWMAAAGILVEYGVFWQMFTELGVKKNWSEEYSRRMFIYCGIMAVGIMLFIKSVFTWAEEEQVFAAIAFLSARMYLLHAVFMEDNRELKTGIDSL